MPIEQIPDSDLRYFLVAFDGEGRERTDDPAGLMSERVVSALEDQPITDVFIMSHGWRADVPSAKRQYAAWIGAMLECTDDLARMRATRPKWRRCASAVRRGRAFGRAMTLQACDRDRSARDA